MAPTRASFHRMKVNMELNFFKENYIKKNSADIVRKKKLLMLIKSDFSFSHINFGSYSPSKNEHSLYTCTTNSQHTLHYPHVILFYKFAYMIMVIEIQPPKKIVCGKKGIKARQT